MGAQQEMDNLGSGMGQGSSIAAAYEVKLARDVSLDCQSVCKLDLMNYLFILVSLAYNMKIG